MNICYHCKKEIIDFRFADYLNDLEMCLKEIVEDIPRIDKKRFYRQILDKAEGK